MTGKWLAAAFGLEMMALAAIGLVALDVRSHKRVESLGGVNLWGYRGAVLHQKQANEVRIAVVGGDLAFGWGVAAEETLAAYLRRLVVLDLDRTGGANRTVTAVNLAARGLMPAEYAGWLERFAYLQPDVVCVVPDPVSHPLNDGRFLPDRHSLAFALFGYSPILPLVLQERGAISHSMAIGAAGRVLAIADLRANTETPAVANSAAAVGAAADAAVRLAPMGVVVVMPPDEDAVLRGAVVAAARTRVVDLAETIALRGDDLRLDRFHFSAGGHSRAAEAVAPAVLQLIHAAESTRR